MLVGLNTVIQNEGVNADLVQHKRYRLTLVVGTLCVASSGENYNAPPLLIALSLCGIRSNCGLGLTVLGFVIGSSVLPKLNTLFFHFNHFPFKRS